MPGAGLAAAGPAGPEGDDRRARAPWPRRWPGRLHGRSRGRGVLAGLDRNHVRGAAARGQRRGDPGDHLRGGHPPVQQQHLDQRPGPGAVTVPGPRCGPERLMDAGEHPGRTGLGQRCRAGQRAGLADQDLQVVIQLQVLIPGRDQPRVDRGQPRAVQDAQLVRRQHHPDPGTDQPGRYRITAFPHADPGIPVHPRPQHRRGLERLGRQRQQQAPLRGEVLPDRGRPASDMAGILGGVRLGQPGVKLRQRTGPRHRHEPAAAEPADLPLDPALLMRALRAGQAVERLEPVMSPEGQPPLGLGPVPSGQHLGHRRRQVVIADLPGWHPAHHLERGHVPLQERLLRLAGEHPVAGLARIRQPAGEHETPRQLPVQLDRHVPEVDLGLGARLPGLRHEPVQALRAVPVPRADLGPAARHVLSHIRIRHLRAVLISQPLEDPPGSMPLLARRGQVLPENLINPPGHRLAHRRGPRRDLAIRRHRRRDRLPHRTAVHVILPRQRPDRHLIALPVEADRREQLHSPLHPAPPEQDKHQIAQRSARTPQMSRNTPGVSPATQSRRGQIRRELPPPRSSQWGQIKGEQWGHSRVLRPPNSIASASQRADGVNPQHGDRRDRRTRRRGR